MPSVRQIAKQAGVSTATVSRVLNNHPRVSDAARQKVLLAANESRYVPTVSRRSTSNIAFMYTGDSSLGSPFDAALLQGMSDGMQKYDYDLIILDANRARQPHETWSQMFLRKGIRGAVLRTDARAHDVCEAIAAEGFPAVVVGDRFENPNVSFIYSDSRGTSREAVEHLIGLGHRRIGIVMNVVDDSDHADRFEGYLLALKEHGIEHDPRLVIRSPATRIGGTQAMRRVLSLADRPSALFITDPLATVGAINEAQKLDIRVPGDISILGFDDGELRYTVHPQMTAICQDARKMGRAAFDALHDMLDEEDGAPFIKHAMPTWLEVHGSTGPAISRAADPSRGKIMPQP